MVARPNSPLGQRMRVTANGRTPDRAGNDSLTAPPVARVVLPYSVNERLRSDWGFKTSFHSMRSELDCAENATLHVNSRLTASPVAKHTHGRGRAGQIAGQHPNVPEPPAKDPPHDLTQETQYVHSSASCGIGKTASGPGSGNSRSPRSSVDRPSPDRGVETSQVAGKGRNRPPAELIADAML